MMGDSAYRSTIDCFVKTMKNEVHFMPNASIFSLNILVYSLFAKFVSLCNLYDKIFSTCY